jgi:hypothetical protein
LLLRRQTTPLFSASWRSVAVATPPTPPVLHTAALGVSGPGWLGQAADTQLVLPTGHVHCPAVMLHLPTPGQFTGSTPGIVQAAFVIAQTPAVGGHWLSFAQAAPLVLHFPALGQSPFTKQWVASSVQSPLEQSWTAKQIRPVLLHVPKV